jgi:hypothetical protein
METSRPSVRPAVLLAVVVVMAIAGRVQISWLERTTSYRGFRPRNGAEWTFLLVTFALAVASSLFAAVVTKRRVNRILAVLIASAVGGLITASYNTLPGIALGGSIGVVVAYSVAKWIVLAVITFIAAVLSGVVGGTTVLALTGNPGDGWHGPMAWSMSVLACVDGSLLLWRAWRFPTRFRWLRTCGNTVLLLALIAGQWLSLSVDTLRRVWWLGTAHDLCLIPRDESWLYRGVVGVRAFGGGKRVNDRQLETISGWQELWNLQLGGALITDSALVHIGRLRRVTYIGLNDTPITDDGVKALAGVVSLLQIDLRGTQISDRALVHLQSVPGLFTLRLNRTKVTDEGLVHLQGFSRLQELGLAGTCVRGAGLRHLVALPALNDLNLADTEVTDDDLALLAGKPIRTLDLSGTTITDVGIEQLNGVMWLKLARTGVSDQGLVALSQMRFLRLLDLTETQITDRGMAHLTTLGDLTHLQLAGTRITSAGLLALENLPNLHQIDVRRTAVRADELPLLRRRLPNLTVVGDED